MLRRLSLVFAAFIAVAAVWLSMIDSTAGPIIVTQATLSSELPVRDVRQDLAKEGYVNIRTDAHTPTPVSRTVHTQAWTKNDVIVNVSDGYPGGLGHYVIDSIAFGKTADFSRFWCVGDPRDATKLTFMITSANIVRADVESGVAIPTPVRSIGGVSKVTRTSIGCFMSR